MVRSLERGPRRQETPRGLEEEVRGYSGTGRTGVLFCLTPRQGPGSMCRSVPGARFSAHEMKMLNRCQQGHTRPQPPPEGSGNDTPELQNRLSDTSPGSPPRGGVCRQLLSCPWEGGGLRSALRADRDTAAQGGGHGSLRVRWLPLPSCCVILGTLLNIYGPPTPLLQTKGGIFFCLPSWRRAWRKGSPTPGGSD